MDTGNRLSVFCALSKIPHHYSHFPIEVIRTMDGILASMGLFGDKKGSARSLAPSVSEKPVTPKPSAPKPSAAPVASTTESQALAQQHERIDSMKPHSSAPQSSLHSPSSQEDENLDKMSISNQQAPSAVIGSKITFKGELSGDEDLLIQGRVEGTVSLKGNKLTVGKLGKVKANLSAKNIIVDGSVEGDIIADEHIAINASSIVKGNLIAARVTLEDGAKFRGSIDMDIDSPSLGKNNSAETTKLS
jgi:cytoskeletal protein CcmA (bactofilin family)